jgi:hypothetical protein
VEGADDVETVGVDRQFPESVDGDEGRIEVPEVAEPRL